VHAAVTGSGADGWLPGADGQLRCAPLAAPRADDSCRAERSRDAHEQGRPRMSHRRSGRAHGRAARRRLQRPQWLWWAASTLTPWYRGYRSGLRSSATN